LSAYLGSEDEHVAHNTYVQVLADSGLFAEIVYLGLLFGTTIWLGRSAKRCRKIRPGLEAYPLGLQTSLVAFIVGSTFLSRVTFDFYYVLIMMAASWYLVEKSERFRKQPGPTIMLTTSMPVSVSYHPAFGPLAEVKNKDLPTNA
jgi:O-antigen ligase